MGSTLNTEKTAQEGADTLDAAPVSQKPQRDAVGKFLPGCKGGPGRKPVNRMSIQDLREKHQDDMAEVVGGIVDDAKGGDPEARRMAAKILLPSGSSETFLPKLPDLSQDPDVRIGQINQLVSIGKLSLEIGQTLIKLCQAEIESQYASKIREIVRKIEAEPHGNNLDFVLDALCKLPQGSQAEQIVDVTPKEAN
jgi:hypothetical protein